MITSLDGITLIHTLVDPAIYEYENITGDRGLKHQEILKFNADILFEFMMFSILEFDFYRAHGNGD